MIDLQQELKSVHEAAFQWSLHCTQGRRQDAEDALQAAYEALLNGSASFEGRSAFKSFLFGVIRNKARSLRRKKKLGRLVRLDAIREPSVEPTDRVDSETTERKARVREAILSLSPKQRDVLELVFYHDLTIEEAAQVMGVRLGTARTHYKRAKSGIQSYLQDGGYQWTSTTTGS